MNQTDLKLYELLGDKTLSFGCIVKAKLFSTEEEFIMTNEINMTQGGASIYNLERFKQDGVEAKIIGHEPTIADLHRWLDVRFQLWRQWSGFISVWEWVFWTEYESYKSLLSQSEETKIAIISLITSHS